MSASLDNRLLNDFQHHFPLIPQPFHALATELDSNPRTVLERLRELHASGTVSRVGPVFRPNTIGVSTLAAMAVPAHSLEAVAELVNGHPEVNHNYERDHRLNLWFVAVANTTRRLAAVLSDIERHAGCTVLSLPLVRDYHIDLGFPLAREGNEPKKCRVAHFAPVPEASCCGGPAPADAESLVRAIQQGLPLTERPYRDCGCRAGLGESEVIDGIDSLRRSGVIKRFGIIVRHHELGYRANAMVVWNLPDAMADAIGPDLGSRAGVNLCYRRTRRPPQWPYNLFCMIHGKHRGQVTGRIEELSREFGLGTAPRAVLFSTRRFKQRGALYATPAAQLNAAHG